MEIPSNDNTNDAGIESLSACSSIDYRHWMDCDEVASRTMGFHDVTCTSDIDENTTRI